jgi:hypothetical protein
VRIPSLWPKKGFTDEGWGTSRHRVATVKAMAIKRITDDDVLAAIVDRAGDGYCLIADVLPSLPRLRHADRRRAVHRAVGRGLVLERRGPDGRMHVAVASEGWRQLRAA